jgi:hypothetical protein
MNETCEICKAGETDDNRIFEIRVPDEPDGTGRRRFCEICLLYGAEMYESYMQGRNKPTSSCRKGSSH